MSPYYIEWCPAQSKCSSNAYYFKILLFKVTISTSRGWSLSYWQLNGQQAASIWYAAITLLFKKERNHKFSPSAVVFNRPRWTAKWDVSDQWLKYRVTAPKCGRSWHKLKKRKRAWHMPSQKLEWWFTIVLAIDVLQRSQGNQMKRILPF